MKHEKLTKNESRMLTNSVFLKRLVNYTHQNKEQRICEAWIDTAPYDYKMPEVFSTVFLSICYAIIEVKA